MVVALKKTDLYSSLWKSCDELRGGMDASQYKDYILTLLFVKYVSDKAKSDPNSLIEVPSGGSFDDLVTFKGDKEIGDKINKAIGKLAEANDLQKVIDLADFNDEEKLGKGKEMQDRLTNLVAIFQDLDFRGSRAEGDDLLGDAYEYLMRHFATESGKSKGQFYTPAEVSRVMAKLIGITPGTPFSTTVYDPTCGSGSLLLKVADESPHGLTIYGQEKDNATWALAKMNMILHGNEIADIRKGDTISNPQFLKSDQLQTFDLLVANPPFSVKSWSNGLERDYGRFEFGMPPAKNGDYAFLLHMLKSLKSTGRGAVILPHGVLFRGNAEGQIRKEILRRGFIRGVIGLPANLFYGTGIPACILVIDKSESAKRDAVMVIDASKGYTKDGSKNRLRSRDMHKIVDVFLKQSNIPGYSRLVPLQEIADASNDYNLNIARYVDSSEKEDVQDLRGHLHGGIPDADLDQLTGLWDAFPLLRDRLVRAVRDGYSELAVSPGDAKQVILDAEEVSEFREGSVELVRDWWRSHREAILAVNAETVPSELVSGLSESLLSRFERRPLVDPYAVYEQFMSYWHETMHDDVALVMREGWEKAARPRAAIEDKNRKIAETPDLVLGSGRSAAKYKMDLVPPDLIANAYFESDVAEVNRLGRAVELAITELEDFIDEHCCDDGLLSSLAEDGKVSKSAVTASLRQARQEPVDRDELQGLERLLELFEAEGKAKKNLRSAQDSLDSAVLARYGSLDPESIRSIVFDKKWEDAIVRRVDGEVITALATLASRLSALGSRYEYTLGELRGRVDELDGRLRSHLALMGLV